MTIALEIAGPAQGILLTSPSVAPADAIPHQATPTLTVSLTGGCEAPLEALKGASERAVHCHPCDEAVVRLLLGRLRRSCVDLVVTVAVSPGTLSLA